MTQLDYESAQTPHKTNIVYKVLLDYIIGHAERDQRPYLEISVLDYPILGLLDSGSTATVVGPRGLKILLNLGLQLDTSRQGRCTVANGDTCSSTGVLKTPVTLMGRIRVIDILFVPSLADVLILGTDFWIEMDIVPDLKRNVWHFGKDKEIQMCGIVSDSDLTAEQRLELDVLLKGKFQLMGNGLGYTTAAEHEIVLKGNTAPIKQRYYPVSP